MINREVRKAHKVRQESQREANVALSERLTYEEKFYNAIIIAEELISRVKRELKGDAVELAKTC